MQHSKCYGSMTVTRQCLAHAASHHHWAECHHGLQACSYRAVRVISIILGIAYITLAMMPLFVVVHSFVCHIESLSSNGSKIYSDSDSCYGMTLTIDLAASTAVFFSQQGASNNHTTLHTARSFPNRVVKTTARPLPPLTCKLTKPPSRTIHKLDD